jgi:rfaE bifunctional protein nucleotidyltransferase chain/domain
MRSNKKLLSLADAVAKRIELRASGRKLTITNGCFDLLHAGHVHYLQEAYEQGDTLWLLLNSDASVRMLKGPARPVQREEYRAYVMAALECIDAVIMFETPRLDAEIRALSPDIYVKAGDYTIDSINPVEKAALIEVGADIRFLPFLEGFSSSELMQKIRQAK